MARLATKRPQPTSNGKAKTQDHPRHQLLQSSELKNNHAVTDREPGQIDDLAENEFIVQAIKRHRSTKHGLKFLVKWEGWDKESDMTWEPEAHLRDCSALEEYFDQVGGREKIWKESAITTSRKRVARGPRSDFSMAGKASNMSSTKVAEWTPPAGSWEDEIESITGFDDENGGKLTVYLAWKNGKKTRHTTTVVHSKCPQKMLQWYEKHVVIIRSAGANLPEETECRVPGLPKVD